MAGQIPILSEASGPVPCSVMLVGEAPGRRGATRTGIPFNGDATGQRFDRLLDAAGWSRSDVFITNAVLCGPLDARGRNRPPRNDEVSRCSSWLSRQVEIVDPVLVVALGTVALQALRLVSHHELRVRNACDDAINWNGRWLAAAYHPSARAAIHRSFEAQLDDFRRLGQWLMNLNGGRGASL